jgi:hypothetical protein
MIPEQKTVAAAAETVTKVVTTASIKSHLLDRRFEYAIALIVCHLLGLSDRLLAQVPAMCIWGNGEFRAKRVNSAQFLGKKCLFTAHARPSYEQLLSCSKEPIPRVDWGSESASRHLHKMWQGVDWMNLTSIFFTRCHRCGYDYCGCWRWLGFQSKSTNQINRFVRTEIDLISNVENHVAKL